MTTSQESTAILIACVIGLMISVSMITTAIVSERYEKAAIAHGVGTYNKSGKFEFKVMNP